MILGLATDGKQFWIEKRVWLPWPRWKPLQPHVKYDNRTVGTEALSELLPNIEFTEWSLIRDGLRKWIKL